MFTMKYLHKRFIPRLNEESSKGWSWLKPPPLGHVLHIFTFILFAVTGLTVPSQKVTSAVTNAAFPGVCCCVHLGLRLMCRSRCANMKRHIRIIGALPASIAQHNQCLGALLEQLFELQSGTKREGGNQGTGFAVNTTANKPRMLWELVPAG